VKAIVRTKYGSPDILEFKDVDIPIPTENQVLVKIAANSVNPIDWHMLRGTPILLRLAGFGLLKPKRQIFGADLAGTVEAVGNNVTQFKVGDKVFGSSIGSFAEYACVSASKLALKPESVSFEQAAALPVAGLTALQALRDHGQIQPGQHVLINGASGGVGTFAVQLAKQFGAQVTAVCSGKNSDLMRSIGADEVIDYTKETFWQKNTRYDLILDNVAFGSILKPVRALKPAGKYILIGGAFSNFLSLVFLQMFFSKKDGKRITSMLTSVNTKDLTTLAQLTESGKIKSVIDRTYALREIPEALRYMETGRASGKVVIKVQS
jgi:NADPH:quinone reductase-like Zn-dependent oxidoreductase